MSGVKLNNKQRKYVPHLPTMLAVCEVNYARLLRLMPDCDTEDLRYEFSVSDSIHYSLTIIETSRYTTTVTLAQSVDKVPDYLRPRMDIRLYHDAQMAEVISAQNVSAFKPSYAYPNANMHQPNEKEMVNRFLAECLQFCLQNLPSRRSSQV